MRSSNQSSNRTFSLIHDILNDIDLGYPERISDFQASDIPVIDQVIGKMAADAKHRLELSDVTMSGYSGNIIKYSSLSLDFFIAIRLPPHLSFPLWSR